MYSSTLVKVLWDTERAILTSVAICPNSFSMPQLSSGSSNRSIQNRLSISWR